MCAFLFGEQCHRNTEWVAANLELLIGLALPHVTEQVPAGLSNASCCSEHCLPWLYGDDINAHVILKLPVLTESPINYLKTGF